jgi:hypothetical protein
MISKIIKLYADKEYINALITATEDFTKKVNNKDTKKVLKEFKSIKKLLCQK